MHLTVLVVLFAKKCVQIQPHTACQIQNVFFMVR